jgi:hypothetical protein
LNSRPSKYIINPIITLTILSYGLMEPVEIAEKKEEPMDSDQNATMEAKLLPEQHPSEHIVDMGGQEIVDLEGQPQADAIAPDANPEGVVLIQQFVPDRPSEFYKNVWFARWVFLGSIFLSIPQIMIPIMLSDNYCDVIQSRFSNSWLNILILGQISGAVLGLRREGGNYNFIYAFCLFYYITILMGEIIGAGTVYQNHCGQLERIYMAFYWLSILLPIVLYLIFRCIYIKYRVREQNAPIIPQPEGLHLRDMIYTFPYCEHNKEGGIVQGDGHNETHTKCSICLSDYVLGERVLELPCNHMFHCNCIVPHFDRSNECPMCKRVYRFT